MNRHNSVSLGPGASSLILIFVVLALAVLGMLTLMTARNDLKFSERSAQVTEAVFKLNEKAEERHAEVDRLLAKCAAEAADDEEYLTLVKDVLPEDMVLEEDKINWTESDDVRSLDLSLQVLPLSKQERSVWVRHNLMAETGDEWDW